MDIQALRYFVAVAQNGSFTRASSACYVSEPALSRAVKRLEAQYDVRLFDRHPRGIRLTKAGENLKHCAQKVLEACDTMDNCMLSLQVPRDTLIRIGYTTGGEQHYVGEIKALATCAPVAFSAMRVAPKDGLSQLQSGELDALIINEPMIRGAQFIRYVVLRHNGMSAFIASDHPLSSFESIPIEMLADFKLATFPRHPGEASYDEMMSVLNAHGVPIEIAAYCTTTSSFLAMIQVERYVGIMMSDSRYALSNDPIKSIRIPAFDGHFNIVLAWSERSPKSELLCDITRDLKV